MAMVNLLIFQDRTSFYEVSFITYVLSISKSPLEIFRAEIKFQTFTVFPLKPSICKIFVQCGYDRDCEMGVRSPLHPSLQDLFVRFIVSSHNISERIFRKIPIPQNILNLSIQILRCEPLEKILATQRAV